MRITEIALYSNNVEMITFSLIYKNPPTQYIIKNIAGLDAEEITPRFYGFGEVSKSRFYEFGLKSREIVMRIALNPRFKLDESFSDIRDYLYKTISSNRTGLIVLHFRSGATVVSRIFGFITKFESIYFTALPEVQITIRCDNPMFRGINPVTMDADEMNSSNPLLVPDSVSTAPHGFTLALEWTAAAESLMISDAETSPDAIFTITPPGGFLVGDQLYFSSEYANKYLYIMRGAEQIHLMNSIVPNSIWPTMFPGQNEFWFTDFASFDWLGAEYYTAYWGV